MPVQILFVSFKINIPPAEYAQAIQPLIDHVLNAPGLRWKIWLINHADCLAGGIYLFDDAASVQIFLASQLMEGLQNHVAFTNLALMSFDVLPTETVLTHGPIGKGMRV